MPFSDCVQCRSRFCKHQPDPQWLKPAYGYPAGQGVYSCGESFPVVAVGRDNVASQENRRVELVFAPKDLQLKGASSKNVNMKAGDCAVYNKERVELKEISVACMDLHKNDWVFSS